MKKWVYLSALLVLISILTACSYPLTIKNYDLYTVPTKICRVDQKPRIAILPFSGRPDEIFYFNAVVNRLNMAPNISDLYTDYISFRAASGDNLPDFILSLRPTVIYRSSGWNFLINWPGFLIFTPAWHGYVYYADIMTQVDIQDNQGNVISQMEIPITYSIRQAEFDRTVFTGLTWFEASLLAFGGGIYNANVFDRDIIGQLQVQVKDNYSNFIANELISRISATSRALQLSSDAN